jgi:glycine cleavage system aminomethyltransferase T
MSVDEEYRYVRHAAAISRMNHVRVVRIQGEDATEAFDAICAGDLWVRDGRMRQTLILDERGEPVADVYVCPDDESCILMFEGMQTSEISDAMGRHADPGLDAELVDLDGSHELISVNGPYAWEVMSKWLTPDIIGLPYLCFYHFDLKTCFRAGKTGEYGYDVLVPHDHVVAAWQELAALVGSIGGGEASLQTLDLCALENGFYSVRNGSVAGLTPLELQLQWRVSTRKRFPGVDAVAARRAEGVRRRMTHFVARGPVGPDDEIRHEDVVVGTVQSAAFSPGFGGFVGTALLDVEVAHPGIDSLIAQGKDAGESIRTVSSPMVFNRSLLVDPHRHSHATRDASNDPPLFQEGVP